MLGKETGNNCLSNIHQCFVNQSILINIQNNSFGNINIEEFNILNSFGF